MTQAIPHRRDRNTAPNMDVQVLLQPEFVCAG